MKLLKVYLDTSVINFLFADDAPDYMKITIDFFENYIKKGLYEVYVSNVVLDEIYKTENEEKKIKLLNVISKYDLRILTLNEEENKLANIYVDEQIIPKKKIDDARHIAISTMNNLDILLSWNFRHLANVHKKLQIKIINEKMGYFYPLDLLTPIQLIYEND